MSGLRVVVCDEHRVARDAFAAYLSTQPRIDTVVTAATAHEAVRAAADGADVLVLALRLGNDETALDVLEALRNRDIPVPVLILGEVRDLDLAARALAVGALGYLPDTSAPTDLNAAIREVSAGHAFVPEELVDPLLRQLRAEMHVAEQAQLLFDSLTARERQVLQHLAQGLSRHDIARRLGLSSNTVRTHLRNVMQKLGVSTQLAAAARARQMYDALTPTWGAGAAPAVVVQLPHASDADHPGARDRTLHVPH